MSDVDFRGDQAFVYRTDPMARVVRCFHDGEKRPGLRRKSFLAWE
ncbi:MAG: hypothetical protein U0894_07390 [Pirellulales bacterium]